MEWNPVEDLLLISSAQKNGDGSWEAVATGMNSAAPSVRSHSRQTFSPQECEARFKLIAVSADASQNTESSNITVLASKLLQKQTSLATQYLRDTISQKEQTILQNRAHLQKIHLGELDFELLKQANIGIPTSTPSKDDSDVVGVSDELKQKFSKVIDRIWKNRVSEPFRNPVTLEEAPDYFDVIRNPMDLATIKTKIAQGSIKSKKELWQDISLIFENACTYNEQGTAMWTMSENLKEFSQKIVSEILGDDDMSDAEATAGASAVSGEGVATRGKRKPKESGILKSGDYV